MVRYSSAYTVLGVFWTVKKCLDLQVNDWFVCMSPLYLESSCLKWYTDSYYLCFASLSSFIARSLVIHVILMFPLSHKNPYMETTVYFNTAGYSCSKQHTTYSPCFLALARCLIIHVNTTAIFEFHQPGAHSTLTDVDELLSNVLYCI